MSWQTFGDKGCHPERSEGSLRQASEILRCAQDDSQDPAHGKPYLQMSSLKEGLLKKDSRLRYSLEGVKRESCSERAGISLCLCCNTALWWSKGERISAMFSVGQGRGCPPRSISASLPARV